MENMNYDIILRAKVDDYINTKEEIEKRYTYLKSEHSEVIHFSKQPVDYDNLLSGDKFRAVLKNNQCKVKFKKEVAEENEGVTISEQRSFEVNDFDSFESLMHALGIVIFAREILNANIFKISSEPNLFLKLVNVEELGYFLEVRFLCNTEHDKDFAKEKVKKILSDLSIGNENVVRDYYLHLILKKEKEKNLEEGK